MSNSLSPEILQPAVAKANDAEDQASLAAMPITQHLTVLRQHLVKIVAVLLGFFFCLLPFANKTYSTLSEPLRAQLPAQSTMIATDVTATFMAPFKLNFFIAILLAMPFIIYQLWSFVKPALFEKEKSLAFPLLFGSIVLFYAGIAFAYFVALPSILHFFISVSPDTVALFLVFGLTFEIPIITLVLILIGLVNTQTLVEKRRFIIVGCFFVAMFATPPDAISMVMLAVPMWLLFEVGLFFGKLLEKRKNTADAESNA